MHHPLLSLTFPLMTCTGRKEGSAGRSVDAWILICEGVHSVLLLVLIYMGNRKQRVLAHCLTMGSLLMSSCSYWIFIGCMFESHPKVKQKWWKVPNPSLENCQSKKWNHKVIAMLATGSYSRLMLVVGGMMLLFGITSVDNTIFIGRYS